MSGDIDLSHINFFKKVKKHKIGITSEQCQSRGDCTIMTISVATGIPYETVYNDLKKKSGRANLLKNVPIRLFHKTLIEHGFKSSIGKQGKYYNKNIVTTLLTSKKIARSKKVVIAVADESRHVMPFTKKNNGTWVMHDISNRAHNKHILFHELMEEKIYAIYWK